MKSRTNTAGTARLCSAIILLSGQALAADRSQPLITVTAPGMEQSIEDVQATIEVIDAQDLQSLSGRSLPQVLQSATGFFVRDSGSTSSVYLRGFDDDQTLILVNGMRRTGKYGHSDLNGIQLADVERIEIIRGPMSALYGSDSMAGVINIITRRADDRVSFTNTVISGLADNDQRETWILRGSANLGRVGAAGHRFAYELKDRAPFRDDPTQVGTDLRDEEKLSFSYQGDYRLGQRDRIEWSAEWIDQDDNGLSTTAYPTYEREERYQVGGRYHTENDSRIVDISLGYGASDAEVDRGTGNEAIDYSQGELNAYLTLFPNLAHIVTLGAGGTREDIDVSVYSQTADRQVHYLLVQDQWEFAPDYSLAAGVRYDDYSDFGSTVNPRVTLHWSNDGWLARLGYGTAFKAPTFTDMYIHITRQRGPFISDISGNPNLEPEESQTLEAAFGYRGARYGFEAIYHSSQLDNLIASEITGSAGFTTLYSYNNIAEAKTRGIELIFDTEINDWWKLSASLEYLRATNEITGERLADRPDRQARISNVFTLGEQSTLYVNLQTTRDFYAADATRTNVNSDFTTLDLKFAHRLNAHHQVAAGVDNAMNREIPYNMGARGYPNDPGARYYYVEYTASF
ncbi:MAG: TonB-dependent receptor [Proteobacteria bacterium]|nr:MAG: TonB-dependent receptor [Pseudomonadota bacterium]QKK10867.1 MAG: TonB-dependent receptor [Pseudomonadota bacterium]